MAVTNVDVKRAHEMQTSDGYVYVDVRSVPEYQNGHPAGAVNVPLLHHDPQRGGMTPNPEFVSVMQANFPLDAKLLIGCQMGGRSAHAAQLLAAQGYQTVYNVAGGYGGARDPMSGREIAPGWESSGLPVETEAPAGGGYEDLARKAGGE